MYKKIGMALVGSALLVGCTPGVSVSPQTEPAQPKKNICRDAQGLPMNDPFGNIPEADTAACRSMLAPLEGARPCRLKNGMVIYDSLGRAVPDDAYCEARREKVRQRLADKAL